MALHENTWQELLYEFPPLWNRGDLQFRDKEVTRRCLEQLLEKCNRMSDVPVTLEMLEKKLNNVRKLCKSSLNTNESSTIQPPNPPSAAVNNSPQDATENRSSKQTRRWTHRMEELAAEFPCLWDSTDLNYTDRVLKARCREQLLVKYNRLASIPITMDTLRKRLTALSRCKHRKQRIQKSAAAQPEGPSGLSGEDLSNQDINSNSPCNTPSADTSSCVVLNVTTQQTPALLTLVFYCCCFCGEVKSDCTIVTDKPYVTDDKVPWLHPFKTILTFNDLSINLDFNKDTTPKTVCQACDVKMTDMYEFMKVVKKAHDKMHAAEAIKIDDDEGQNVDSITVTDTEFVKTTHKGKRESTETKKKCSVTIDLSGSSPDNDTNKSEMVDIEAKYKMFRRENTTTAPATKTKTTKSDKTTVSNNSKDDDTEDDNVINDVKEEIEIHHNHNGQPRVEVPNGQNERNKVDGTSKIAPINIPSQPNTFESENAEAIANSSVASELTTKNEVCMISKSDLIQLVESIVTRMLNK